MSLLLAGALRLVLIEAPLPAAGDTTPEPSGDVKTLAVMYFENRSVGSEWQWLSTGIADMLIVDLGRSERLLVVERERLARMLTELRLVEGGLIDPANAAKVGQVTKVEWVLFGSFEKKGDSLTIEGHILEVKSGQLLRVEQVEGKAEEVLALEKRLAEQLLGRLDVPLTEEERRLLDRKPTDSLDALTHYYQGIEAYESGDYHRALAEFRAAARQDAAYVDARFQEARMYSRIGEPQHSLIEYRRLTESDTDKSLPDQVYYTMGQLLETAFEDSRGALAAYRAVVDRRPEFRVTLEEVRSVRRQRAAEAEKLRAEDEERRAKGDYSSASRGTVRSWQSAVRSWERLLLACRALERVGGCQQELGEEAETRHAYEVLARLVQMQGPVASSYYPVVSMVRGLAEKAPGPWLVPPEGLSVEVMWDDWAGLSGGPTGQPFSGARREFVAGAGREIRSLDIATVAVPPLSAMERERIEEVSVDLMRCVREGAKTNAKLDRQIATWERRLVGANYPQPYAKGLRPQCVTSEGVVVKESAPSGVEGRDYHVELPPGLDAVALEVRGADVRCRVTSGPWRGPRTSTPAEGVGWADYDIAVDPQPPQDIFIDGIRCPPGFALKTFLPTLAFRSTRLPVHVVAVRWSDGRTAQTSFRLRRGQKTTVLVTPEKRILHRQVLAGKGGSPSLLRDRHGRFWVVWAARLEEGPEASQGDGADLYCSSSADGWTWEEPRRLSLSSTENDRGPTLQQDSGGTFWLLWASPATPGEPRPALWLASSPDGRTWSYPRKVQLPVPNGQDMVGWYGGYSFLVDTGDRFWLAGANRSTYSDDGTHWAEAREVPSAPSGRTSHFSLGCDRAGGVLLIVEEDPQSPSSAALPILYSSKDGAKWTKVGAMDGGFQPDNHPKLEPKIEEAQGNTLRRPCRVEMVRGDDGTFLATFTGGGPLYVARSSDCRTWRDPAMVDAPPSWSGFAGFSVAPAGPGRCVVAVATEEGLSVLLCQVPSAAARQEAGTPHPPITGALEAGAMEGSAQPTILILPFRGGEGTELGALGDGLADLLSIDLTRQEGVSVVDRAHLTRVLQEQKLSLSGLVDQTAQLQVGKLLGAKLLLAGSFVLTQGKLTVTAHLFDVSTAQLVKSEGASGEVSNWLEVEKALALALAKDLDLKLDEVQVRAIDEKPEVNLHFIRGLGYYYASRHDEAIMEFLNTLFGDEKYVDARYWMARSYLATGEPEHARLEFERILREYTHHSLASESQRLLDALPRTGEGAMRAKP